MIVLRKMSSANCVTLWVPLHQAQKQTVPALFKCQYLFLLSHRSILKKNTGKVGANETHCLLILLFSSLSPH